MSKQLYSLFIDDAKLLRNIRNHKDCEELQNDINKIYEWSKTWEMQFHVKKKKCHVLAMGNSAMRSSWTYKLGENTFYQRRERFGSGNTGQLITRETYRLNI